MHSLTKNAMARSKSFPRPIGIGYYMSYFLHLRFPAFRKKLQHHLFSSNFPGISSPFTANVVLLTWHDMTCHDMSWHDMTWHDMTWHGMTWHDMTWHDMTWHDMAWHGMTWQDMHGMAWHDKTWHDMTWHGMAWHGMACHVNRGILPHL